MFTQWNSVTNSMKKNQTDKLTNMEFYFLKKIYLLERAVVRASGERDRERGRENPKHTPR